jgi:hypothetical protein
MKWTIQKLPRYHELEAKIEPEFASFAAGEELAGTVQDHVRAASSSRHRTASRLGATPTGHLSEGAANIRMEEDGGKAVVTVPIPGITRAFGDLHIRPKDKKWLTIPINAVAYGVRAPEMQDDGWQLFSVQSKKKPGTRILFGREAGAKSALALYLLRDEVDVPQDRGLMPSEEEMGEALAIGVSDEIERTRT